ncbi:hypothetical protein ACF1DY_07205 [Streptomyces albus]|uniref:hypothetical protein n=1 Tax=Streptomyces albus TaxID=1888 RepID=UPI0036FD5730
MSMREEEIAGWLLPGRDAEGNPLTVPSWTFATREERVAEVVRHRYGGEVRRSEDHMYVTTPVNEIAVELISMIPGGERNSAAEEGIRIEYRLIRSLDTGIFALSSSSEKFAKSLHEAVPGNERRGEVGELSLVLKEKRFTTRSGMQVVYVWPEARRREAADGGAFDLAA